MSDTTTRSSGGQGQSDAFAFLDQMPNEQILALRDAVRQQVRSRGLAAPKAEKAGRKAGEGGGKRRKAAQGS